jgi:hypothetical protein
MTAWLDDNCGADGWATFDFSRMISGAWCHRFVIHVDAVSGESAFLIYGSRFAQLLELPEKPISGVPTTRQLPGRYRRFLPRAVARQSPKRHPSG